MFKIILLLKILININIILKIRYINKYFSKKYFLKKIDLNDLSISYNFKYKFINCSNKCKINNDLFDMILSIDNYKIGYKESNIDNVKTFIKNNLSYDSTQDNIIKIFNYKKIEVLKNKVFSFNSILFIRNLKNKKISVISKILRKYKIPCYSLEDDLFDKNNFNNDLDEGDKYILNLKLDQDSLNLCKLENELPNCIKIDFNKSINNIIKILNNKYLYNIKPLTLKKLDKLIEKKQTIILINQFLNENNDILYIFRYYFELNKNNNYNIYTYSNRSILLNKKIKQILSHNLIRYNLLVIDLNYDKYNYKKYIYDDDQSSPYLTYDFVEDFFNKFNNKQLMQVYKSEKAITNTNMLYNFVGSNFELNILNNSKNILLAILFNEESDLYKKLINKLLELSKKLVKQDIWISYINGDKNDIKQWELDGESTILFYKSSDKNDPIMYEEDINSLKTQDLIDFILKNINIKVEL